MIEKLRQKDVIVTRNPVNGSYECSAIIQGYRKSRVYYGYPKRECVRLFVEEYKSD